MSIRRGTKLLRFWCTVIGLTTLATLGLATTTNTGKVDDPAVFELDGDAVQNLSAGGDEWDLINNGAGHTAEILDHTGVVPDAFSLSEDSIFKSGASKDISGINPSSSKGWQWAVLSGPPDKDDLTNAYAVAYDVQSTVTGAHELWAYFGADRFDNSGDALIGYWFFQDGNVGPTGGGNFGGHHTDGDILVITSFLNGGTIPLVNVRKWSCTGTGQACDASGILVDLGSSQEKCNPSSPSFDVCATTNSGNAIVPTITNGHAWDYYNKSAVTTSNKNGKTITFPARTFFEGGINLSHFGDAQCFSKFMAETRSSTDLTKSVNKDFVLAPFNTCKLSTSKVCGQGGLVSSGSQVQYPATITINATGFGSSDASFEITKVVDTAKLQHSDGSVSYLGIPECLPQYSPCTPGSFDNLAGDTPLPSSFTLTGSETFTEHFTAPSGTTALSNDVHVEASVGGSTKTADFTGAPCSYPPTSISASLLCATQAPVIVAVSSGTIPGGHVVASDVQLIGTVTNPSGHDQYDNVSLSDDQAGALSFCVSGGTNCSTCTKSTTIPVLAPGTSVSSCPKDYQPSHCDPLSGPQTFDGTCAFTDTVTASGTDHITGYALGSTQSVFGKPTGTDTCHYCPSGFCSASITQ